jgi:hypothetical protein
MATTCRAVVQVKQTHAWRAACTNHLLLLLASQQLAGRPNRMQLYVVGQLVAFLHRFCDNKPLKRCVDEAECEGGEADLANPCHDQAYLEPCTLL